MEWLTNPEIWASLLALTALEIVLEAGTCPTFVTVRDLVQVPTMRQVPAIGVPVLDLSAYDQLIASRRDCV